MRDNRLKSLKESWNQLDEMPAWYDGHKDIARYIKGNIDDYVSRKMENGFHEIEKDIPIRTSFAMNVYQRGKTLMAAIYLDNSEVVDHRAYAGEFFWYNQDGKWNTESVAVNSRYQGLGLAFATYVYMIENHMHTLYSDVTLTGEEGKGSFDVWVKLGKYFNYKYIYNIEEDMLEAVDGFTREMMGDENIRFVVSVEEAIEDADESVTESLVSLPENSIRQWLAKNTDELLEKIQETYTQGYNTYVEDTIDMDGRPITVNIQKKLLSTSDDMDTALYFNEKEDAIYISANALVDNLKKMDKIKAYVIRGIWHELTHVNDPDRLAHKQDFTSYDSYVNSPREFPAFARMFIEEIKNSDPAIKAEVIDALQRGKKTPLKDLDKWYKKLTPENKKKFISYCQKLVEPNA